MNLQDIGNGGYWPTIDDSDDLSEREHTLHQQDLLTRKVLSLIQKVVSNYANLGDHAALDILQSCLSKIMRQASMATQEGKKMKITDNENSDLQ